MNQQLKYSPAGDNGLIIGFGKDIQIETNQRIRGFQLLLEGSKDKFIEIIETIPAYTTLFILYDPLISSYATLVEKLMELETKLRNTQIPKANMIHIPVLYGEEYGPDLTFVAKHNGLGKEEVIRIHSENPYLIYMIGFTPGFPYLGGMSEKIATPRLVVPRQKIAAGSVGIAGNQTGIYPIDSPGGWQIIGRTPIKLFDLEHDPAVLLRAGDYIAFSPIDQEEYHRIELLVAKGEYKAIKSSVGEVTNHG